MQHLNKHHPKEDKYICDLCGVADSHKTRFFKHLKSENHKKKLVSKIVSMVHGQYPAYLSLYEITNNSLSSLTLKPKNFNVE